MRNAIIVTTVILLLGSIPATTAEHLSAGVQDGVGLSPDETPDEEGRTVPGTEVGVEDTPYGIATQTDCYDAQGAVDADEIQNATSHDSLCGELVYHKDTPINTTSTPDQHLYDPIKSFDVIHTRSYRTMTYTGVAADIGGYSYCAPMCPSDSTIQPVGGDTMWDTFHNATAILGLTDEGGTAKEDAPDNRGQQYAVNAYVPGPGVTVQRETGIWDLNGWMVPHIENTFIAYPEDQNGDIITAEQLGNIVTNQPEGRLDPTTSARICAYSPDIELTTVAPGAAGTRCELPFRFRGEPQEDSGDVRFDGYDDRCKSPSYVCGAVNGPAWYAEFCLCFGFTNPDLPGAGPVLGFDNIFIGDEGSQTDYLRWHHVIAPHNSRCSGAQEPGISFEPDGGEIPYLAHDVDIYVPATTLSAVDSARSVQSTHDWAEAAVDRGVQTVLDLQDNATEELAGLPGIPSDVTDTLNETADAVDNASYLVNKDDRLEPNNAEPVGGLDDTSQSKETDPQLVRDFENFCESLHSDEDEDTIDPWVDYIDSRIQGHAQALGAEAELYDNQDRHQDASNRPGPELYSTTGMVGMFTDKNDDGDYDQAPGGTKYEHDTVQSTGAYPMMWDMVLEDSGEDRGAPDQDGGCAPSDDVNLVEAMVELGYGPNTGLVQAVYLNEPTTFVDTASGQPLSYEEGQNIYLIMSQGARVQYTNDTANPMKDRIEDLVDRLTTYVTENTDAGEDDIDVVIPAEQMGLRTGLEHQCNGSTGNFDSRVQFAHSCQLDCSGDTIATMYTFQLTDPDGKLQGAPLLPGFFGTGDEAYEFGQDTHTWYDIDPFDNDPERNDEETEGPPTAE